MRTLLLLCSVIIPHGLAFTTQDPTETTLATLVTDVTDPEAVTGNSSSTASCGGTLSGGSGSFYSPNYPGLYPHNADCVWYIRPSNPSNNHIVKLEFRDVNIQAGASCMYDAIFVYDGPTTQSRLMGKVCGTTNSAYHLTIRPMTIRFKTDSTINDRGFYATYRVVADGSCRNNCGYQAGDCSCLPGCRNCCPDYTTYCPTSTAPPPTPTPTARPSCRYNCGRHLGSCSCSSSCQYYGNCCYDYNRYCPTTTAAPARPSCRYNCGNHMGSCSCSSSCQYYGNCCYDYNRYCPTTTAAPARPSCRYNCGNHMGSCSCSSSCQYYGNCCYDYNRYCPTTTAAPARPSCRYNCGRHLGSCSCSSSCQYYGNCCYDYNRYCPTTTAAPARPSCRYNCGRHLGSCSCSSSCQYYGNCCYDYYRYCPTTTAAPIRPSAGPCGGYLQGSGSFSSPYYPSYYHDNAYCVWYLRARNGERLVLSITDLQLESCACCDYIAVYDGSSLNSPLLGRVCQNSSAALDSFHSSSSYLTVLFRTDSSVVGRGFNAEFTSSLSPSSGRVDCSSDRMNIVIEMSYLNSLGYDGNNLYYVNDQYCRPQVSRYRVVFNFPINSCGTVVQTRENGRTVYSNTVRGYTSSYGEVTRQSHLKVNVSCRMEQETMVQIMYVARERENSTITGTGRFNGSMAFYTSSSFNYKVTEVPYKVTLNQYMYVQVNLRGDDRNLVLFLDTCVASPSPHDFHSRYYDLVRNGCSRDSTYHDYTSGSRSYARFRFQAFQFLRAHDSVYLQCKVLVCPASDYSSRCRRGCSNRKARDLGSAHDSHTLVLGPIQLKDLEKLDNATPKEEEKA